MRMKLNPRSWFKNTKVADLEAKLHKLESEFGIVIHSKNFAGINVNQQTALKSETVYTCIRDKAESIGQLPIIVKRNGKIVEKTTREYRILALKPNDFQTMQDFVEMYVTCMETTGQFFAYPVYNKYGNLAELLPLRHQNNVRANMDTYGRVYYTYTTNDGKPITTFAGGELMHIKLNSLDGLNGLSPISAAARSIGISISQEQHLSSLMEKGSMTQGVLTTEAVFKDPTALQRVKDQWAESYGGSRNNGKTPLLEGGLKYQALSLSPVDSELIKQRTFSRIQLAGIFRVPLSRVGITDAQRYNSVEENNRAYLRDSLIPLMTKLEAGISGLSNNVYTIEFDVKQYIRGDRKSQVEAIGSEIKLGLISIGEGREDLGRERKEGDDVHAIDTNNLTFGTLTDIPKLQAAAQAQAAAKPKPEVPKQ